jgi:hypothetical protein
MSELDDFFDEAALDATALVEVRRVRLESLMQCTVLWDDEATLDAIMYGPMDDQTYHHLTRPMDTDTDGKVYQILY